jgi:hypothetical protein
LFLLFVRHNHVRPPPRASASAIPCPLLMPPSGPTLPLRSIVICSASYRILPSSSAALLRLRFSREITTPLPTPICFYIATGGGGTRAVVGVAATAVGVTEVATTLRWQEEPLRHSRRHPSHHHSLAGRRPNLSRPSPLPSGVEAAY